MALSYGQPNLSFSCDRVNWMKRVFTSPDSAEVGLLKSLLEEAGIECFTRNETQAYTGVAFHPELWIVSDEDEPAAEKICREWRQSAADQTRWKCTTCGEELEGQFAACWNCGSPRSLTVPPGAPSREHKPLPELSAPEGKPRFVWKPVPDFIVILQAIAAFLLELYYRGVYQENRTAALQHPAQTALSFTGKEMSLKDAWSNTSGFSKWFHDWHETRTNYDYAGYCEYILRDTIVFFQGSRSSSTNVTRLRANLVVLLAEYGPWQKCTNDLRLLEADPGASNFVIAARAVYETNTSISIGEIKDPAAVLGDTWFATKFDFRWSRLKGDDTEFARLTKSLADASRRLREKQLIVVGVATAGQALGVLGLLWALLTRRSLTSRRDLTVPWQGWEGLGIFFAAWSLGILFNLVLRDFGLFTLSHYAHDLIMWTPLVWLVCQRHGSASLKQLLSLSPMSSRGLTLIAAGLAVFLITGLASRSVHAVAYAFGLRSHWADAIYEPAMYEPWNLRWMILVNAVVIGPIGEEILCRGVLFLALKKWFSLITAAVLSAIAFSLPHYYGWPGFLGLVAVGTVGALSVHFTGSLAPAIIGHVLTNLILAAGFSWVFGK